MELRQESLFADETKGGIEVIYSKFIDQRRMDYKALFGGFDHLRVITFSYGLGFVETVADMFEDVEIIIGSMNTVRPDIVDVAMHQKLEMKRLSKRKQLVERVKDGSVRIYFNMRKMSHEKLYILSADDGRCRIITGSANLSKRAFTGGQYEEITCFDGDVIEGMDAVEDATTCFPHTEDGVPFCWDYQIKGFFKDACSALRRVPGTRSSKLTAFKKVIDGTVFVEQRRIPFQLPEGAECGRCERPLRASSASGERVALAASETVPAGTVLEFSILVMNPKDAETVREWLDYGALRGLFQWRNSGKGRFEWEEVAKED